MGILLEAKMISLEEGIGSSGSKPVLSEAQSFLLGSRSSLEKAIIAVVLKAASVASEMTSLARKST